MQEAILKDLNSLIQLDIDAIYCYDQAIERIDDRDIALSLETFRDDHQRHVEQLSALAVSYGGEPPERTPDMKGHLLKGMTALRSATGTEGALKAMEMNEKMTSEKYSDAQQWSVPSDIQIVLERDLADERRHLEYIRSELHVGA